jgi:Domain of unknown function (DUF1707)
VAALPLESHPMVLAGDGEREEALISLREHFVQGRLTLDEFSERTELVMRSRYRDELRRACDGLPKRAAHPIATTLLRGASLVLFTGIWLMFSLVLVVVLALTLLIHGATVGEFAGFLLVWLVPTYLLSRLWRKSPFQHVS